MRLKERLNRMKDELLTSMIFENEEVESFEEEWYYDQAEMIWKRNPETGTMNRILWFDGSLHHTASVTM